MTARLAFRISAILGFLAVALGAMGAHAFKDLFAENGRGPTWETAAFYHLTHAIVLAGLAWKTPFLKGAWWAFFIGVLIFSGTLYILCLTNITMLGAITPIGGVALLIGWAYLIAKA